MNASHFVHRVLLIVGVLAIPASLHAQTRQAERPIYEPSIGQRGKDVVWVPTGQVLVDKMLDMANVTPQDYVIDLGSGDGRTVITAAKRGARALGIEYNPDLVKLSKRNAAKERVSDRATFVKADLFKTDFSRATTITMFLLPELNLRLRPKILALKPGTRIVSNTFPMGDWLADETETVTLEDGCTTWCTARLWIVPAIVEGTWRLLQGELVLTQAFQIVSGTLSSGDAATSITDGRLRGDQISFSAGGARYTGRVDGNTMEGTLTFGEASREWTASRIGQAKSQ